MQMSVMLYSFATALRSGEMSPSEVIGFIHSLGVDAIELMRAYPLDAQGERVLLDLRERGLRVSCFDLGVDFVQNTREGREAALDEARQGIDEAAGLGSKAVLIVPGSWKDHVPRDLAKESVFWGLAKAARYAADLGVTPTIEDHSLAAVTGATSTELLEACAAAGDCLKITFDTGNFLSGGEDPLEAWDRLASRVAHVHVKDWEPVPAGATSLPRQRSARSGAVYVGATLGRGVVPNAAILERMKQSGYDGFLSVEYEGNDDPRTEVRAGVEYLRSLLV